MITAVWDPDRKDVVEMVKVGGHESTQHERHASEGPEGVLAGVSGSRVDAAVVEWASDEAVRLETPLRLVHVVDTGGLMTPYPALMAGAPNLSENLEREAQALLTSAATRARERHPDLVVLTRVLWGLPSASLVELSTDARRLVIGGSRPTALERVLLGSVALPVVAHARCPVAVVPEGAAVAALSHVVVGVDGSSCSAVALETAFETAAAGGSALTCVIGWNAELSSGISVFEAYAQGAAKVESDCLAVAHEVIDPVAARYAHVPVEVVVRRGHPADVIVKTAADVGADLVVVGSRGRGGFIGLLLGSVSRRVVHRAGLVVLVAH